MTAPLDQEKYAHMKTHPEIGARILGVVKDFERIRVMVRAHHEHYDGSGYPDGQKGLETPLGARIIAVADVYDALTTDRPYRAAWKKEKALQVIQEKAGSQFDPQVVPVFISIMGAKQLRVWRSQRAPWKHNKETRY